MKTGFLTQGNAQRQLLTELDANELCQCLAGISLSLFSKAILLFPQLRGFFLNLRSLITDVALVLGSIATNHNKVREAERSMIPACTVAISLQGQQVVRLSLFSTCKTRETNIENIKIYRDSFLSLQEDVVICKMNAARHCSIKLAGINREPKTINVSLQLTVHFGVLNDMPTSRELLFAIT